MEFFKTLLEAAANSPKPLPVPLCSVVADVLGSYYYNHKSLEPLFYEAGAQGEVPDGNCVTKCESWLKRMHKDVPDAAAVLGRVLEKFMEVDDTFRSDVQEPGRKRIHDMLAKYGLAYHTGGIILGAAAALPTKSLQGMLKARDLGEVDKEFGRALAHVESDPLRRLQPRAQFWNRCLRSISRTTNWKCLATKALSRFGKQSASSSALIRRQ